MIDFKKIIDGKKFSEDLRDSITAEVAALKAEVGEKKPGLAVILVGHDPASEVYVKNKDKQAKACGMNSFEYKFPETISEKELIKKINELNEDAKVHGILVQLPLPKHISELAVIDAISPEKDVDGFHAVNRGRLVAGQDSLVPCTPLGCLMLIKDKMGEHLEGLNAVVIGRSNIVGKPMAQLLLNEGCTVTTCHSKTKDIKDITKTADILVVAIGKPDFVNKEWVKDGACVIDVGINRIKDGDKFRLTGDVDFKSVAPHSRFITPVPGGVGPMTIACLLNNTLKAFKKIEKVS